MPVLMLGGLGVCAGYAFAVWVKGQEPPKGKDPSIKHASLGVIRLDWHYHPLAGDVGSTDSFEYPVFYRAVPGLTFEVCQSGVMTPEIKEHFKEAIRYLDQDKQVSVITSDCGFFMWFQKEARQYTAKPVVMSSLALLPAIHAALGTDGKIAIFSANSESLQPMHDTVAREMGVDWNADCYVLVGCQDVEGFEAVATGEPVDLGKVTPGIVKKAVEVTKTKNIHAILMECTQLPPFSDDVRAATGLPVYDAIVCADFFVRGFVDNPRFGLNGWHQRWDGKQETYKLGDVEEKEKLVYYSPTH
mmetsp:Transcript_62291/g.136379  ORF Transcript_62291/g.136379 Transcript_62291/m.136379 type:complete len:302 (-) Transcript_62291:269-1174(-)